MPQPPASSNEPISALIRRARPADTGAILEMIGQLARHHGDNPSASLAALERDLFGATPWVSALVADRAGTLLGYAILCRVYRAQLGERGMDLHHLFVVEAARNRGIGRCLVTAAIDEARSCGCIYLVIGTHPDNVEAHRFYAGLGFEQAAQAGPRHVVRIPSG